jgi:hypothetical protein
MENIELLHNKRFALKKLGRTEESEQCLARAQDLEKLEQRKTSI